MSHKFPNQTILVCDDQGNFTGEYIPIGEGHTGKGKRHIGIAVLLYNSKGEMLLQHRKHLVFDKLWDLTGATHPLHLGGRDETVLECTKRCLEVEWGVKGVDLKDIGAFSYYSPDGDLCENEAEPLFCENEYCHLLIGEYDGEVKLNPDKGYGYKWLSKKEFLEELDRNPDIYSPWAKEGRKLLLQKGFFN